MKVLSLSGGGIRGVMVAQILANLERTTKKRCNELFDLVVGTSTGAILAAGLGLGVPAIELRNLYMTHGRLLFSRNWFGRTKYSVKRANRMLRFNLFGPHTFASCRKARVSLCATNVESGAAVFLNSCENPRLLLTDAVTGAIAAPVYFEPWYVPGAGWLADGGLFANNPALFGTLYNAQLAEVSLANAKVLDIGCGLTRLPKWNGKWSQKRTIDLAIAAGSDAMRSTSRLLFGQNYCSINPSLGYAAEAFDDARETNIQHLVEAGENVSISQITSFIACN